ncbi:MAG: ATP-binding protein [Solirubrobacteraceae bacterium]
MNPGDLFVGRKLELESLDAELAHVRATGEGRFAWICGRRRVGKSRLVQELVESSGEPYVFYQAPRRSLPEGLERFRRALEDSNLPAAQLVREGARFEGWPAALRLASQEATPQRPAVIVIDELPYLVESDRGVPADIQEAWDRDLRRRPVLLVCIGSDVRMMRALTQHPAELFGRPTREMLVAPFSPRDLAALSGLEAIEALDRYLIVGGLPMIARSWPHSANRRHYLERALADPSSPLVVDGMRILDAEFPAELQARSVLEAIGHGERTFTAIGVRSGVANHTGLTSALGLLTAKGIVNARLPYAAPPGRKNKRYVVADPYLRFWLRFIAGGVEEIDRGRSDLLLARIERDWSAFRGMAIESIVRRSLERLLPDRRFGDARYVGGYWTRKNVPEVDLVGADAPEPSSVSFVGSIKWRENAPFSRRDTRSLIEQRSQVPGADEALLVGVSRRGFSADTGLDVELSPEDLLNAWPES